MDIPNPDEVARAAGIGLCYLDDQGEVTWANEVFGDLLRSAPEIDIPGLLSNDNAVSKNASCFEKRIPVQDGDTRRWLSLRVVSTGITQRIGVLIDVTDTETRSHAVAIDRSLLQQRVTALERHNAAVASRVTRLVEASEGERRRIATDLHDTAIQQIAAALLMLEMEGIGVDSPARSQLSTAVAAVRDLLDSIRHPLLDESGVLVAVRDELENRPGLGNNAAVSFCDLTGGTPIPTAAESFVWRAAVASIRAARSDPSVHHISVSIGCDATSITGSVVDDGTGPRDLRHPIGSPTDIGAAGDIVAAIGGTFDIVSDGGWAVTFTIPCDWTAVSSPVVAGAPS